MRISLRRSLGFSLGVSLPALISASLVTVAHGQSGSNDIGFAGADICVPDIIAIPQVLQDAPDLPDDELPTNVEADGIETVGGSDQLKLVGNAQVIQGNRGVFAEQIEFDQETYMAGARGGVTFYTGNGDEISAEELEMEVDTFIGSASNVSMHIADTSPYYTTREHYRFQETYSIIAPFRNQETRVKPPQVLNKDKTFAKARATAEKLEFEGKDYQLLHGATMSTCTEGNDDILLTAKEIELDHATGTGSAENMTVRFKNVPIFYFPKVTFPINDERKTGFLFPGVWYEDESGTIIAIPYYINIAPQHDATITPALLSKRGVQLFGEYRYLTQNSNGALRGEFLPSDDVFGDDRYAISYNHRQTFGAYNRWRADVDVQDVSDTEYLRDFSTDVDVGAATYIPQTANLNYSDSNYNFRARLSAYERVNSQVSEEGQPYERLPQITFDVRQQDLGMFKYGLDTEYTNFSHDDSNRVDGSRVRLLPYLSLPLQEIYGYIKPKISVQTINYSLDNNPTGDDSPSVAVPIASIDSKLFFERIIKSNDSDNVFLQTLEPRLFYLNIPTEEEQNLFPDFDTGGGSNSSFSHFFRENRFFGGDRVGDAHQLSVGLTSRIINDDTGEEKFNLSLGQIFYFDDREVVLNPVTDEPDTTDESDFIAEATAFLADDWNIRAFTRYSNEESELDFISLTLDYFHSSRRSASIAYTRDLADGASINDQQQVNLRLETPLAAKWQLDARVDYDLEDSEVRTAEVGLYYDGCCWATGLTAQRYVDSRGEYANRYFVTFELDDLGRITSRL